MAVNDLTFNQVSTLLTDLNEQATGQKVIAPSNTSEFVSLAQTLLKTGYDPVLGAISQVLGKTIMSIRAYNRKFADLAVDENRWGNHVRKITFIDDNPENDGRYLSDTFTDGESIDQWEIKKPKVIQTNFYGKNVYQRHRTFYKDQLDVAFRGPDEFARFVSSVSLHDSNMMEQDHEDLARAALANFIAGCYLQDANSLAPSRAIHLLTEYNSWSGNDVTAATVFNPSNFADFARWFFGRLVTLSKMMTERSLLFHQSFETTDDPAVDLPVMRHTPKADQRLYLNTGIMDQVAANVLSTTYHDKYLDTLPREDVNFWQNINSPGNIKVTAGYTTATGGVTSASANLSTVFGVLMDTEAVKMVTVNQWSQATPMNAKGGYSNMFYHYTDQYWNDYTENGVVLLLD